jgi:hypothetical protein
MLTVAENHSRSVRIALLEGNGRGGRGTGPTPGPAASDTRHATSGSARVAEPVATR